ncbi:glycosyltransferase [Baekduia soli]|uniref:Glycosyltransferase n=2 Tax=Baekduia soli TaxID=496014 RepID=A0A5B8UCI0_9ACTN|nr:glycosyltransferase [Baekduia soli]
MAIAAALRERGHEVAFYSGDAVRETIEREGYAFFGFDRVDQERAFAAMRVVDDGTTKGRPGRGRLLPILRDWMVETIPDQIADLDDVLARFAPDVIATDLSLWGPIMVLHDRGPVPVALSSTFMGPLIPGPDAPAFGFGLPAPTTARSRLAARAITAAIEAGGAPLRRRVDEIRAGFGLPAVKESVNRYTARLPLYLVGNIRELDYDRHDLPESVHYVGNCLWFPPEAAGAAAWLDAIPAERPWVHVTESTLAYGDPFLLRMAAEALADEPVEVIVTTGRQRDSVVQALGALPPNVHVTDWLNHGDLLPRCAAVVTVGGKATILSAMEAGVPLVLVPTTWDKPDNARRVTRVGAGVRIPARRCTAPDLRAAVRQVLDDPRHRAAARDMAARLAAAPGPAAAADLLEALVGAPAPAPAPGPVLQEGHA